MHNYLFITITACLILSLRSIHGSEEIEKLITNHFSSDHMAEYIRKWSKVKLPYESAMKSVSQYKDLLGKHPNAANQRHEHDTSLALWYIIATLGFQNLKILQEQSGKGTMNVYFKDQNTPLDLADALHIHDFVIDVVLKNLKLRGMPRYIMPDVHLDVPGDVIQTQISLSKMVVEADYVLFRNHTNILYQGSVQDPYKNSPFVFQQVQDEGTLAIISEGCSLSGLGVVTIYRSLQSDVELEFTNFKVSGCKFSVEISTPGLGSPPVVAPYLTMDSKLIFETLLSKVLRTNLNPRVQSALYTYLNTSGVFEDTLRAFRSEQKDLFIAVTNYMRRLVSCVEEEFVKNTDKYPKKLSDYRIVWTTQQHGQIRTNTIEMSDMMLAGLDTLYSASDGGAYRLYKGLHIAEEFRFDHINIHGAFTIMDPYVNETLHFSATFHDIGAKALFSLKGNKEFKDDGQGNVNSDGDHRPELSTIDVVPWRKIDFSIGVMNPILKLKGPEEIIKGYILHEILSIVRLYLQKEFLEILQSSCMSDIAKSSSKHKNQENKTESENKDDQKVTTEVTGDDEEIPNNSDNSIEQNVTEPGQDSAKFSGTKFYESKFFDTKMYVSDETDGPPFYANSQAEWDQPDRGPGQGSVTLKSDTSVTLNNKFYGSKFFESKMFGSQKDKYPPLYDETVLEDLPDGSGKTDSSISIYDEEKFLEDEKAFVDSQNINHYDYIHEGSDVIDEGAQSNKFSDSLSVEGTTEAQSTTSQSGVGSHNYYISEYSTLGDYNDYSLLLSEAPAASKEKGAKDYNYNDEPPADRNQEVIQYDNEGLVGNSDGASKYYDDEVVVHGEPGANQDYTTNNEGPVNGGNAATKGESDEHDNKQSHSKTFGNKFFSESFFGNNKMLRSETKKEKSQKNHPKNVSMLKSKNQGVLINEEDPIRTPYKDKLIPKKNGEFTDSLKSKTLKTKKEIRTKKEMSDNEIKK